MSSEKREPLPSGTRLDYYKVHKLIGSGGFSLIYLGEEEDSHDEVAIKEYMPKRFGNRNEKGEIIFANEEAKDKFYRGLRLFFLEAKALAMLRHPNIVNVRNCFLDNETAYLVMDYQPGKNLGRYIKRRKGGLSTRFLMTVFPPLLDALELIHNAQHLHLDIKPGNIHIRPGGRPLLLDFGAVYHLSTEGKKKAQVITPGFSPIEQYRGISKVGPWTDIYAIGASMRTCIEGKPPPTAIERHAKDTMVPAVEAFGKRYPRHILQAIDHAMEIDPQKRIQSAALLLKQLNKDQACLRPRDRFWDIPVPKIDSAFDNLLVPQPSWSPSTTQQLRKLVAAPYLAPNDWTPRSETYFVFPLAQGTPGKQCGLAATGVYQPSLRSPWLAAPAKSGARKAG